MTPSPSLAANPELGRWLDFSRPGRVIIHPGKVEYGQGVWTALAQIAAEELDVALDQVEVAPVSTDTSPDEGVTSGSRSIEDSGGALHQACAQARAAFLAAAAAKLDTSPARLTVRDGEICTARGAGTGLASTELASTGLASTELVTTGLSYWTLDEPGLLDRAAAEPAVAKPASQWSVAGRSAPRRDLPDKATGRPRFLHDLVLPGMVFGRVIRPPGPAATLDGVGPADLPDGVLAVLRDGSFLGVLARQDRIAVAAAARLARAARWTVLESLPDERNLKGFLLSQPTEDQAVVQRHDPAAAAQVRSTHQAEFTRPFIAHASMAPSCAIARWDSGPDGTPRITVWTHSQGPFPLRRALAAGLGLDPGQLTVHHVEGAGVYGHNASDDAAADAVLLARELPGRPVRVLWSREDELGWGPVGPAMLARLSAGLDGSGRIQTWRQDVWSNGFLGRPGIGGEPRLLGLSHTAGGTPIPAAPDGVPSGAMGATRNAVPGYGIPDLAVTRHRLRTMPIRTSSLRSLGAFLNVFAIESFMDELAGLAGADPAAFRLAHLTDPRARRVIEEVAGFAGWAGRPRTEGTGFGLAFARYKGTSGYCAAVAEVAADTSIALRRLWLAVDVGRVINPDGVRNQVEGGALQSASWALRERVRFDRTRITSVTWESYPILRFTEMPEVAVRVVASDEAETGAGELAQGPVAGAIGNAVADAIGVRVRDLPLTTEQITRAIEES